METKSLGRGVGRRFRIASVVSLAASILAGCGAPALAPVSSPAPDPAPVAVELQRSTTPISPRQVAFGWELDEAGSRLRGRGVARLVAPERLRLDLFGPRGETYLSAALVGEEFRIPPAARDRVALPSPALLWGALGVVRPPADAVPIEASTTPEQTVVRYRTPDSQTFEYLARDGRLVRVQRVVRGEVVESIDLSWSDAGELDQTRYRDWAAFRTLVLTPESSTDVASFPENVWRP